jgi:hypothetical protein
VEQVLLALGIERIAAGEVLEDAVDLLEVPGVPYLDLMQPDLGLGRHRDQIFADGLRQRDVAALVKELEPVDQQIVVLADGYARPPRLPARRTFAAVQAHAEEAEHDTMG